jgi:hypothetical protein
MISWFGPFLSLDVLLFFLVDSGDRVKRRSQRRSEPIFSLPKMRWKLSGNVIEEAISTSNGHVWDFSRTSAAMRVSNPNRSPVTINR